MLFLAAIDFASKSLLTDDQMEQDAYHLLENVARWHKPDVFGVVKYVMYPIIIWGIRELQDLILRL